MIEHDITKAINALNDKYGGILHDAVSFNVHRSSSYDPDHNTDRYDTYSVVIELSGFVVHTPKENL